VRQIFGIVGKTRWNEPESGRPLCESVFVKADAQGVLRLEAVPTVEWTANRDEARTLPWEEAEALAKQLGWPTHAVTVSMEPEILEVSHEGAQAGRHEGKCQAQRDFRPAHRHQSVSPQECFERLEKRHLG